jgi:serine protease AprX
MRSQIKKRFNRLRGRILLQCFVLSTLLLSTFFTAATPVYTSRGSGVDDGSAQVTTHLKAQPEVLQLAESNPQSPVPVIVQKAGTDDTLEEWVVRNGGELVQPLSIINAFAARVPAASLPELAAMEEVRWISLDGPVASASTAKNSFFLHGASSEGDSATQPFLPLDRSVPMAPVLFNLDAGRDDEPGLSLLPGGNAGSTFDSGQIQRWRMAPFESDVTVNKNISLRLYAAVKDFERGITNKLTGHLIRVGPNGEQLGVIATTSVERTWGRDWRRATLKFSVTGLTFRAGESLEVALTNDGPQTMWLAFGTHHYPAHLRAVIKDAMVTSTNFYLSSGSTIPVDGTSRPVLPFVYTAPPEVVLPNYDTDLDSQPGLLLKRSEESPTTAGSGQAQRWRLPTLVADTQMAPNSEFEFFAAVKGFQKRKPATVWAYLNEVGPDGNVVQVVGSGFYASNDWDDKFASKRIDFRNPTTVLHAGNYLELVLVVDSTSSDDLWIAFNTKAYPSQLKTSFWTLLPHTLLDTIDATEAWAQGYEGQDVGVAVIDSGVWKDSPEFIDQTPSGTVRRLTHYFGITMNEDDKYGHGSFIASVIAGNGSTSGGYYKGVAPKAEIISVRVSNEWGGATESTVVAGMQWVLQNHSAFNIRVVNLSLNSAVEQPSALSPLNAAAEILWFNGIVVVTSSGNNGMKNPGVLYPPANDPFVIAVGATEEMENGDPADDVLANFSAYGVTPEGYSRPDIAAPGAYIVSALAEHSRFRSDFVNNHSGAMDASGKIVTKQFVASGTSISAGVVSGAAALLLQALPDLNPDQVKYLLMASATAMADTPGAGAGQINIARAIALGQSYGSVTDIPTANSGLPVSQLLYTGSDPVQWNSVNWNSVNWNSVNWNSVNWNSVNWNSIDSGATVDSAGAESTSVQTPLFSDEDEIPSDEVEQSTPADRLFLPALER